jgi:hypothetical protein
MDAIEWDVAAGEEFGNEHQGFLPGGEGNTEKSSF